MSLVQKIGQVSTDVLSLQARQYPSPNLINRLALIYTDEWFWSVCDNIWLFYSLTQASLSEASMEPYKEGLCPIICLFACVLAGLCKFYWMDLHKKNEKMGFGST